MGDFGFAVRCERGDLVRESGGSPYHMAPEVYLEKLHCPFGADVWALGVVLYEMLTSKKPFEMSDDFSAGDCRKYKATVINGQVRELLELVFQYQPADRAPVRELIKHRWLRRAVHPRVLFPV